ncbi:hypothetical protein EVAR_84914_1 [Eumeta japonica]|uniref:Uncharacterized protein n=1 Tax=Eumeta variegata TaxID=151549 RepID=A0A4C1Z4Z6_EUMVA|nr:hypothetical protein EVAR_84914_1 [Eumeta japonica]
MQGRRKKGRRALNLRIALFTSNLEWQSFLRCTVRKIDRARPSPGQARSSLTPLDGTRYVPRQQQASNSLTSLTAGEIMKAMKEGSPSSSVLISRRRRLLTFVRMFAFGTHPCSDFGNAFHRRLFDELVWTLVPNQSRTDFTLVSQSSRLATPSTYGRSIYLHHVAQIEQLRLTTNVVPNHSPYISTTDCRRHESRLATPITFRGMLVVLSSPFTLHTAVYMGKSQLRRPYGRTRGEDRLRGLHTPLFCEDATDFSLYTTAIRVNCRTDYGEFCGASGGARRRRRRRPPTASRLKGPRKQKSFAYKLLKRGLANLMSPTSTSGVAPPLCGASRTLTVERRM